VERTTIAGETEELGENLPQRHFVPPQIPHDQVRFPTPDHSGGKPATTRLSYGAAFGNLDLQLVIKRAWETIRQTITISVKGSSGCYKQKKHKPWCDGGCSELLYQRKQDKLQWLQDPSEINGDNLNNIRPETRRHFGIRRTI
jgi:hypothetical protein